MTDAHMKINRNNNRSKDKFRYIFVGNLSSFPYYLVLYLLAYFPCNITLKVHQTRRDDHSGNVKINTR